MADEVAVAPVVEQVAAPVEAPEVDLITRVSQFKKTQVAQPAKSNVDIGFDYKEIEGIQDPIAKEIAIKAYKSMEAGVQKKFQDLASQRREVEAQQQQMVESAKNWSPERIQNELLSNPQFLQAAQAVAGNSSNQSNLTEEQYSALTENEKSEFSAIKSQNSVLANEINSLKQVNYQAIVAQKDVNLQAKYPDYNPVEIDNTIKQLATMSPLDIREHVYKSIRHDEDVKAAYELGRSESKQLSQQKINAFAPNGSTMNNSGDFPVRDKSDNDMSWFSKIANYRLAQSKKR